MPYLVFDTETSGLPDWRQPADAPSQPRMASFALLFVDDDLEIESRHHGLVRPDGWTLSAEAAAVNGLSHETLMENGLDVRLPLALVRAAIDGGRTLVAHNLSFDTKIMRGELRRAGVSDQGCSDGICTMRGLTDLCGIPKPSGYGLKFPKLTEACKILLNKDLTGAHDALVDAKACLWLLRVMKIRGLLNREAA